MCEQTDQTRHATNAVAHTFAGGFCILLCSAFCCHCGFCLAISWVFVSLRGHFRVIDRVRQERILFDGWRSGNSTYTPRLRPESRAPTPLHTVSENQYLTIEFWSEHTERILPKELLRGAEGRFLGSGPPSLGSIPRQATLRPPVSAPIELLRTIHTSECSQLLASDFDSD